MNLGNKGAFRGMLSLVLIVSVGLHVLGLVVFGVVKIAQEVMREPPTFEAPPVVRPPEPPPPPPPLEQRNQQSSPPRPNPITVQTDRNIELPALDIDVNVDSSSGYGRGGIGEGNIRELSLDLEFFGASATGDKVVMILDVTHSGAGIFKKTRNELLKTLDQMRGVSTARFAVIYFGGSDAGHITPRGGNMDIDPTEEDYWFPKGVPNRKWIEPGTQNAERIIEELKSVDPSNPATKVKNRSDLGKKDAFFVLGTQYWGAINAAFRMRPAPDTIFFMVEPRIAFPNRQKTKQSWEWFDEHGRRKPSETTVHFIYAGNPSEESMKGMRWMVNQLNGGDLSDKRIEELMTRAE